MPENCPIQVTPLAQSSPQSAPNIFNLNYTNQDFWSLKSRLVTYIQQNFATQFTDFVESDLAIMLIENWAFIADTLSFKTDQIANEIFIDTVTELDNAFRLAELVGFFPQPPIASRSLWSATLNNPQTQDVSIAAPYAISVSFNSQNIIIELFPADSNNNPIFNQDIVIPAGAIANNSIIGLQGQTFTDLFTGTGAANQSLQLTHSPVIFDSIRLSIDGTSWTQVQFFTDSQPRKEFLIQFDSNYNAFVIFGNSQAGLIPSQGSIITVTYRVGGGVVGNIISGFVTTQTLATLQGVGFSVPVSLTNYTSGQFGYDGDTIDDIRQKLPAYLQTQNRAVSGSDYKTLADQFATPYNGKVGKSTAVLRNYGCAANVIDLYVLAADGINGLIPASNDLKVMLQDYFANIQMFTDFLCIRDGVIISVDVTIDVVMNSFYRKFQDQYNAQVTNAANAFFALPNWDYGQSLKAADLIKAMINIQQVEQFEITFTTNDPQNSGQTVVAQFNEVIRPDIISVNFIYD